MRDPSKRFIYVEAAYFVKWWDLQDDAMKENVKMLVNEGRFEFIGGAWSMNDEANTHYQSIIDQFTLGLRFWNDTFGECGRPRVGWQIDPFGHSREQASIFVKMGFDGMFITRLDYQNKARRLSDKSMEMVWQSSQSLSEFFFWTFIELFLSFHLDDSDMFTGALYNEYAAPRGFCFDLTCDDEPIIDDAESPDYNIDSRVRFIERN